MAESRRVANSRVMNGQRAGVCGLVIAGLSLMTACKVMGVPYLALKAALPSGWHTRQKRRASRWIGAELEALERVWLDRSRTVRSIAQEFGVSTKAVGLVARKQGWPRRKRHRIADGTPFGELTAGQRRLFFKLRRNGVGREAALNESVRGGV